MNTVHPYFTAKASQWMRCAGGDPAAAGALARWAQIAWYASRPNNYVYRMQWRGVIIAADGTLLAETRRYGRGPGLMVDHVDVADLKRLTGAGYPTVVDMALGAIRRAVGQPVAHCKFSEVCVGAAPRR